MSEYNKFLEHVYSDELTPNYLNYIDEVHRLMAEDDGWQSYNQWASQLEETERNAVLEQLAFERKQERLARVNVNSVQLFINRDCNHKDCKSSRCSREIRLQGVAI